MSSLRAKHREEKDPPPNFRVNIRQCLITAEQVQPSIAERELESPG